MIVYHKNHVGGFAGNHIAYWPVQPILRQVVTITSAAGPATNRLLLINPPGLDGGFGSPAL